MRVFVYCRVSTDEQATDAHFSLANQEQKARDYAKAKGWRIAGTVKDVASGKDANREGYQELLSCIENRSIDGVVVYRLDRLSRNVKDIYDFLDMIGDAGIAFISLSEGFDTTTAMGRAMLGVAAVFAQLTRELIGENVKDGLMRRAQAGLYNGNKYGPYGYRYDKDIGMLVVVPQEAEVINRIFDMYANRKWGTNKIATLLNREMIPTREGAQWSKYKIMLLVRNCTYIGKVTWHGQEYPGKHDAIVPEEVFATARELIGSRKEQPPRTQQSEHLLSGLAECGICGKKLKLHYGAARKDGTSHRFYTHGKDVKRDSCRGFYKSADKLEAAVINEIRKIAESDFIQKPAIEELEKSIATQLVPLRQERERILAALSDMNVQFNKWADRLDAGAIDEVQFRERNAKLLREKTQMTGRLHEIDLRLAESENLEVSIEAVKQALSIFKGVWDNLEIQERREMLRHLVERLVVYSDHFEMQVILTPPVTMPV